MTSPHARSRTARSSHALAIGWLCAALALLVSTSVSARIRVPHQEIEGWVGYTVVGSDALDDMVSFGFRGGYQLSPFLSTHAEFGMLFTDGEVQNGLQTIGLDYSGFSLAYLAEINFLPDRQYHPYVMGGPGYTFISLDVDGGLAGLSGDIEDDSFTLDWGGGVKIDATDRMLVRPAVRWRWYEGRDEGSIDVEFLFGVGAKLF
jgi:opacity protein-like surface antigen